MIYGVCLRWRRRSCQVRLCWANELVNTLLFFDFLLLIPLIVFVVFWWGRRFPARSVVLPVAAIVSLSAGIYSVSVDRWQAWLGLGVAISMICALAVARLRGKGGKNGLPWLSGTAFLLVISGAAALIMSFPAFRQPELTGPYAVGVRDFEVIDRSRPGVWVAAADEPRRLLVRTWYPAERSRGRTRAYFEPHEAETTAAALGYNLLGQRFFLKYLRHVRTNSIEGASLLEGAQKYPVVFFSHGYTSFPGQNTVLSEELASHGYIVYSIAHTFDSADLVMPNGDVLPSDPRLMDYLSGSDGDRRDFIALRYGKPMDRYAAASRLHAKAVDGRTRILQSASVWLDDRLFVHDTLERGDVPERVAGIVRASKFSSVGEMGMSFGGSTSGAICQIDRRCAAGINLDGRDFHQMSFATNQAAPFMMLYAGLTSADDQSVEDTGGDSPDIKVHGFNDFSYERPETAGLREDIYRLSVKGAMHFGLSDFASFFRGPLRERLLGDTPARELISIQNELVLGFFDKHLRDQENSFPQDVLAAHDTWLFKDDITDVREAWLAENPEDRTIQVVLETDLGDVELSFYRARAPALIDKFLSDVDQGLLDDASFYRVPGKTAATLSIRQGPSHDAVISIHTAGSGLVLSMGAPLDTDTDMRRGPVGRVLRGAGAVERIRDILSNPVPHSSLSAEQASQAYVTVHHARLSSGSSLTEKIP